MTPEELMIPRYKVIADYPGAERYAHHVGDILTDDGQSAVLNQNGDAVFAFEWDKFPTIFKKLKWWEERKPEDMPEYLMLLKEFGYNDTVVKVMAHHSIDVLHGKKVKPYTYPGFFVPIPDGSRHSLRCNRYELCRVATEAEYLAQETGRLAD